MSDIGDRYPEFLGEWSDRLDPERLVGTFWHVDGPHDADTVQSAAAAIDALTHYLARSTAPWAGNVLDHGPYVYRTVGELSSALGRFDQVLDQLSQAVAALAADPTMYDDRRDRPAERTAGELQGALDAARVALGPLAAAMRDAHSASSHLGHDTAGTS
jgi:hypothetical protein